MDFQEAIQKIEERGDFNRYREVKAVFEEELERLKPDDYNERGLCHYYLLVSYLKARLVHETEEAQGFYEVMDSAFLKQEEEYLKNPKGFTASEVKDFYKLMERCYNSLEFLYERHAFKTRRFDAYERKMYFRKNSFWESRKIGAWMGYKFLELSSSYGASLGRWGIAMLSFAFVMSISYMLIDKSVTPDLRMIPDHAHWFDYFYFSTIIMTTAGLGDIYPLTMLGKILTAAEALFGFLMLGIFIGMLQKRIN